METTNTATPIIPAILNFSAGVILSPARPICCFSSAYSFS
jgi:hypothetical protein